LPQYLDATGTAILCIDDERVGAMAMSTRASVVTYGESFGADVHVESLRLDDFGCATTQLRTPWGKCEYALTVPGRHMALNAAAAMAVAGVIGVDIHVAASALASASMTPRRMQLHTLVNGAIVLDDTYNASPASMEAAFATLNEIRAHRRIAVLGPMAELAHPEDEHQRVAAMAREMSIQLIAVGTSLYGVPARSIDEALTELFGVGNGDVVVVKGSRIAELERLVERLVK
jgi:UDP-N-acetylmuramoyl-tripeptide--D-alanyl-D-alanine ligase